MPKDNLADIKHDFDPRIGQRIRLKFNRGRSKAVVREGVLEQTYPSVFVVKLDETCAINRVSYSYADVLTKTVEVTFLAAGIIG